MYFFDFQKKCNKQFCLRGNAKNILNDNCFKEGKQKICYEKYCKKIQKGRDKRENIDYTNTIRNAVLERDKTCRIWSILTDDEQSYIKNNFNEDYEHLSKILDPCHIISRAEAPELIDDVDNVFLGSRYFHNLLDNYMDLITMLPVTKDVRIKWIERIMIENKLWVKDYSYEQFKKEKFKK